MIDSLEILHCLDFGIMATVFVSQFADKKFHTFVIDAGSFHGLNDLIEFALTGDRYQMTAPPSLDADRVMLAHVKLAGTEDAD